VIEQIVGDIEDEYDFDETEDNILVDRSGRYRVKAVTEIADFNNHFDRTSPTRTTTPWAASWSGASGACPSAARRS
jgi:CBS domain containing-hemolysin-like protein